MSARTHVLLCIPLALQVSTVSLAMSQSVHDYFPVKTDLGCSLDRTRGSSSQVYMSRTAKKFQCKNVFVGRVVLRKFFNTKIFITKI